MDLSEYFQLTMGIVTCTLGWCARAMYLKVEKLSDELHNTRENYAHNTEINSLRESLEKRFDRQEDMLLHILKKGHIT